MEGYKDVTLETVAGGAPAELFQREWESVMENVMDPNTEPEAKRKIVMTFTVAPSGDRQQAIVEVEAKSTLAKGRPAQDMVYMTRFRDGAVHSVVSVARQMDLLAQKAEEGVVNMQDRKAGES